MARAKKTAAATDAASKPRAPQKRTFHFFYRTTESGDLEIVNVLTDARKVLAFMDSDAFSGLKRKTYEVVSTPRDDGSHDDQAAETGNDEA